MFDLTYYNYISRFIKNSLFPDLDYTLYNYQITRGIKKKALNDMNNTEDLIFFNLSYQYLINYLNEFINYFNIDTSKFNQLNKFNVVNS